MNIDDIKAWWNLTTGKDIPQGWDGTESECLDYITRECYSSGYNDARNRFGWISVKEREAILPSKSSTIIVTDGNNISLVKVAKFVDIVDTPYCQWTHWMKIPSID